MEGARPEVPTSARRRVTWGHCGALPKRWACEVGGWSLAGRDGAGQDLEATAMATQLEGGPQEAELGCGAGGARGTEGGGVEGQYAGPRKVVLWVPRGSPAWRASWRERVAERSATSPGCLQTPVHRGVQSASGEALRSWLHLGRHLWHAESWWFPCPLP